MTWKKEIDEVSWNYVLGYSFSWNLALLPHPQLFALQNTMCCVIVDPHTSSTRLYEGKTSTDGATLGKTCHLCINLPYLYFIWQSSTFML